MKILITGNVIGLQIDAAGHAVIEDVEAQRLISLGVAIEVHQDEIFVSDGGPAVAGESAAASAAADNNPADAGDAGNAGDAADAGDPADAGDAADAGDPADAGDAADASDAADIAGENTDALNAPSRKRWRKRK